MQNQWIKLPKLVKTRELVKIPELIQTSIFVETPKLGVSTPNAQKQPTLAQIQIIPF